MRLISWNVNGIRAIAERGLSEWLADASPDVLCLQETRVQPDQLADDLRQPTGFGWRIDYFLVSEALMPAVIDASILPDVMGSDHCPIALELDLGLL